jgi:hypothetical protein
MMEITTSSSMSVNARLDSAFIFLQFSILHLSCRRVCGGGQGITQPILLDSIASPGSPIQIFL